MYLRIQIIAMDNDQTWRSSTMAEKELSVDLPDNLADIPDLSSVIVAVTRAAVIEYNAKLNRKPSEEQP